MANCSSQPCARPRLGRGHDARRCRPGCAADRPSGRRTRRPRPDRPGPAARHEHAGLPVCSRRSPRRRARPASRSRTARVTSAPAAARARAVSRPIPEAPPVTTARRPVRSTPASTSAAVELAPNGVLMRWVVTRILPQDAVSGVDSGRTLPESAPLRARSGRKGRVESSRLVVVLGLGPVVGVDSMARVGHGCGIDVGQPHGTPDRVGDPEEVAPPSAATAGRARRWRLDRSRPERTRCTGAARGIRR